MNWQPDPAGRTDWLWRGGDSDELGGGSGSDPARPARPRRWVLHGGHGGCGSVAPASQGPHFAPGTGRPGS